MDAELITLRGDIYRARWEYYRAVRECYETATSEEGKDATEDIFLNATAAAYGEALSKITL
jgi:hypothetical protein